MILDWFWSFEVIRHTSMVVVIDFAKVSWTSEVAKVRPEPALRQDELHLALSKPVIMGHGNGDSGCVFRFVPLAHTALRIVLLP